MILTDSTAVCGPADFSLKDEANRKKLKNFIIEQLYPDDPDGWRAALSVFAVPVWNRFETVWYAPQEIVGFAPKIRRFSEYSTVQQNVFKCRLYEVLQDVFGLGRAMYFDPEKDLYVINDRNPVIIRWGVISEGGNPEPLLQKFFSTCGSDNSQEQTAPGDDFASEGAKFSSSGSESAAPETEPVCTNNGSDSTTSKTEPMSAFNRSFDRNSKPEGKVKVFSSRRPQKEDYYDEDKTGNRGEQDGIAFLIIALIIIGLVINHIDKTGNSGYQGGIALLIIALFVIRGVSKYL